MAKEIIKCNHCGNKIEWYRNSIHETNYTTIDKKDYCGDCLRKLGHKAIDWFYLE